MSTEVCPLPDAANLLAASHIQFDQVMADLTQLEGEVEDMFEGEGWVWRWKEGGGGCGGGGVCVKGRGGCGVGKWGGCGSRRGIMWQHHDLQICLV